MADTRKLAAILAADVAGYSRLAAIDEERTLARSDRPYHRGDVASSQAAQDLPDSSPESIAPRY
jgi:hypothetical protein